MTLSPNARNPSQPARINRQTWALLLLLGLLWGGSFFFARVAVAAIHPVGLVFLRVAIAALALVALLIARHDFRDFLRRRTKDIAILGIVNNIIPFSLIFAGQTEIGAGLASILNATTPVFTILIAQVVTTDEKITRAKVTGALLGLCGTAVLIGPAALGVADKPLWALLAPLGAAISYGFAATFAKRFRGEKPAHVAAGQLSASALLLLPVALVVPGILPSSLPSHGVIASVLTLALLSTALAYLLYFRILSDAGATAASLVTLMVPPSAILLGAMFLGERLAFNELAGMALIALGLLSLDNRLPIRMREKRV